MYESLVEEVNDNIIFKDFIKLYFEKLKEELKREKVKNEENLEKYF